MHCTGLWPCNVLKPLPTPLPYTPAHLAPLACLLPLSLIPQVAMLLEEYYNSGDLNEAAVSLQVRRLVCRRRLSAPGHQGCSSR